MKDVSEYSSMSGIGSLRGLSSFLLFVLVDYERYQ